MSTNARLFKRPCRLQRIGLTGLLLAGLVGCEPPSAKVDLTGSIQLFGPATGLSVSDLSDDWIRLGASPKDHAIISAAADGLSIRLSSGQQPYSLVRRTDASLLAAPFLSWSWRVEASKQPFYPARITIGLRDTLVSGGRRQPTLVFGASRGLPKYDRTIILVWSHSALMRGSVNHITSEPASVRYVVRGGQENADRWWHGPISVETKAV